MTSMETIPNKALSGAEIKAIIAEKFRFMLEQNTRLSNYAAYGRLAYEVTLTLHLDNAVPIQDEIKSTPIGQNIVESIPDLAAIESYPLKNASSNVQVSGTRIRHDIDNPNLERLTHNLPVPVETRMPDGTVRSEEISYPVDFPVDKQKNVIIEEIK